MQVEKREYSSCFGTQLCYVLLGKNLFSHERFFEFIVFDTVVKYLRRNGFFLVQTPEQTVVVSAKDIIICKKRLKICETNNTIFGLHVFLVVKGVNRISCYMDDSFLLLLSSI